MLPVLVTCHWRPSSAGTLLQCIQQWKLKQFLPPKFNKSYAYVPLMQSNCIAVVLNSINLYPNLNICWPSKWSGWWDLYLYQYRAENLPAQKLRRRYNSHYVKETCSTGEWYLLETFVGSECMDRQTFLTKKALPNFTMFLWDLCSYMCFLKFWF